MPNIVGRFLARNDVVLGLDVFDKTGALEAIAVPALRGLQISDGSPVAMLTNSSSTPDGESSITARKKKALSRTLELLRSA